MAMAQMRTMQTAAPDGSLALETRNRQLQSLVGELLETNQQLRFKVAGLERRLERTERGLADATISAGMLLP
jgi:hypothetical protein